ncbi:MAG: hypothetical protein ACTHMP_18925 [Thermomicrobiales bacterium]
MKRQGQVRRTAVATATGQQRWDRAYQLLLQWATTPSEAIAPFPTSREEATHARSGLPARLDDTASTAADDWATARAARPHVHE